MIVLILVLMEDALRVLAHKAGNLSRYVLILVLMEDALRDKYWMTASYQSSLNPCSNGRCSARWLSQAICTLLMRS